MSRLDPVRSADARRLLLVEDDHALAAMLEEILLSADYVVDLARDGQAGLHLGLSRSYDAIVLDRGLPAIEGLDLLGRWRARGVTVPVLVLSALGWLWQRWRDPAGQSKPDPPVALGVSGAT